MRLWSLVPPVGTVCVLSVVAIAGTWQVSGTSVSTAFDSEPAVIKEGSAAAGPGLVLIEEDQSPNPLIWEQPLFAVNRTEEPFLIGAPSDDESQPNMNTLEASSEEFRPPEPRIQLSGTMSTSNRSKALIRSLDTGEEAWEEVGKVIDGWEIVEITQGSVRLRAGNHEIVFLQFE
jgi:hypothetical protein